MLHIIDVVRHRASNRAVFTRVTPQGPPELNTLLSEDWTAGNTAAWDDEGAPLEHSVIADPTGNATTASVLRVDIPADGEAGWLAKFHTGVDEAFYRWRIWLPANFPSGVWRHVCVMGSRSDNLFSGFGKGGVCPVGNDPSNEFFNAFLETGTAYDIGFYTYHAELDQEGTNCFGHQKNASYPNDNTVPRGQWVELALYVKVNDIGQPNGVQYLWMNGTLVGVSNNLVWRETTNLECNTLQLAWRGAVANSYLLVGEIDVLDGIPEGYSTGTTSIPTITIDNGATANVTEAETLQINVSTTGSPSPTVTYGSANEAIATINSTGLVTGVALGTVTITATATNSEGSDNDTIDITVEAAGVLTAGTITEGNHTATTIVATATAATGGDPPYTYQWYNAAGDTAIAGQTTLTLTWTGRTAETQYTYYLIATDSSSATVQYSSVTSTTDAEGGAMWAPNIPAGLTTFVDTQFDSGDWPGGPEQTSPTGSWKFIGAVNEELLTSGNDSSFGPAAARCPQPGDHAGNGIGTSTIYWDGAFNAQQLYLAVDVYIPSNYVIHTNNEKFWYPYRDGQLNFGSGGGTAIEWGLIGAQTATDANFGWRVLTQDGSDPPWVDQNLSVYMTKGQNNHVEIYTKMNTPGQSNGIWRIWINGVLACDYTDMRFSILGQQDAWIVWGIDDTRGGGPSGVLTPTGGQFREYSRMQISYSSTLS